MLALPRVKSWMSLDLPTVFRWFSELKTHWNTRYFPRFNQFNPHPPKFYPVKSCKMPVFPWFSPVFPRFSPVFQKASRCLSTKTGSWSSSRAPRGSKVAQRLWNLGSHRIRTGYRGYMGASQNRRSGTSSGTTPVPYPRSIPPFHTSLKDPFHTFVPYLCSIPLIHTLLYI